MNYLAHIYLSGNSEATKIGNFIGDYVKGKSYTKYPEEIQTGILLHRYIDSFTDSHIITKRMKDYFRPYYRLYSGVIVDMTLDHFLASNWNNYSDIPLNKFTKSFYYSLVKNYRILPAKVKWFVPFIIQSDRLKTYSTLEGLKEALRIMEDRRKIPMFSGKTTEIIQNNYTEFNKQFDLFFQDIITHCQLFLNKID